MIGSLSKKTYGIFGIALFITAFFWFNPLIKRGKNLPPVQTGAATEPREEIPAQIEVTPTLDIPEPAKESRARRRKKRCKKVTRPIIAQPIIKTPQTFINPYGLGFSSQEHERELHNLSIQGTIPAWLNGDFVAVGPGKFEIRKSKARHWFDGFAMLHKFSFKNGTASYANKFVETNYLKESREKGQMSTAASASDPNASFFSKMKSALATDSKPSYDNTNMNIVSFGGCCTALTESAIAVTYNAQTLSTKEPLHYQDTLDPHVTCVHPMYDEQTKEWYGLAITFGNTSSYTIYKLDPETMARTTIATINSAYPAYIHSFSMTKNYIILIEAPFVVSPYDLLMSGKPFIENFQWKPKQGTAIHAIDRHTSTVTKVITDPFFMLHHINAFEQNNSIIVDLCTYEDASIINAFLLEPIHSIKNHFFPPAYVTRLTITLDKKPRVEKRLINSTTPVEMPRINSQWRGKNYQFVYGVGSSTGNSFFDQITKLDVISGNSLTWHEKPCYMTEPVFIPRPESSQEDDGVVVSIVLDTHKQRSFLLILDAKNLTELARVLVPQHIPFTVHGNYYSH